MTTENKYEVIMPEDETITEVTDFYKDYVDMFFKLNFVFMQVIEFILKNKLNNEE